ncbi:MAG: hypothetical protein IJL02_06630 [Methanobrevibacter sp.]|uniref:hypothetical protein n=1 Tax=Methanobrevibacter sp. TaxID=66852 RepID=UPI0025D6E0D3|nr:hypothetical protein [Methanobrevibacter sp.]MBQ6099521.1 hypothetical protein [Methanobrevibacter sp.]
MDFDIRRVDSVKLLIKNIESHQQVEAKYMDDNVNLNRPENYEYRYGDSVLDVMTMDNTNWHFEKDWIKSTKNKEYIKVTSKKDVGQFIDLAKNHPEAYVRIAAIEKIADDEVLLDIIKNDDDETVKKASFKRLEELYLE